MSNPTENTENFSSQLPSARFKRVLRFFFPDAPIPARWEARLTALDSNPSAAGMTFGQMFGKIALASLAEIEKGEKILPVLMAFIDPFVEPEMLTFTTQQLQGKITASALAASLTPADITGVDFLVQTGRNTEKLKFIHPSLQAAFWASKLHNRLKSQTDADQDTTKLFLSVPAPSPKKAFMILLMSSMLLQQASPQTQAVLALTKSLERAPESDTCVRWAAMCLLCSEEIANHAGLTVEQKREALDALLTGISFKAIFEHVVVANAYDSLGSLMLILCDLTPDLQSHPVLQEFAFHCVTFFCHPNSAVAYRAVKACAPLAIQWAGIRHVMNLIMMQTFDTPMEKRQAAFSALAPLLPGDRSLCSLILSQFLFMPWSPLGQNILERLGDCDFEFVFYQLMSWLTAPGHGAEQTVVRHQVALALRKQFQNNRAPNCLARRALLIMTACDRSHSDEIRLAALDALPAPSADHNEQAMLQSLFANPVSFAVKYRIAQLFTPPHSATYDNEEWLFNILSDAYIAYTDVPSKLALIAGFQAFIFYFEADARLPQLTTEICVGVIQDASASYFMKQVAIEALRPSHFPYALQNVEQPFYHDLLCMFDMEGSDEIVACKRAALNFFNRLVQTDNSNFVRVGCYALHYAAQDDDVDVSCEAIVLLTNLPPGARKVEVDPDAIARAEDAQPASSGSPKNVEQRLEDLVKSDDSTVAAVAFEQLCENIVPANLQADYAAATVRLHDKYACVRGFAARKLVVLANSGPSSAGASARAAIKGLLEQQTDDDTGEESDTWLKEALQQIVRSMSFEALLALRPVKMTQLMCNTLCNCLIARSMQQSGTLMVEADTDGRRKILLETHQGRIQLILQNGNFLQPLSFES